MSNQARGLPPRERSKRPERSQVSCTHRAQTRHSHDPRARRGRARGNSGQGWARLFSSNLHGFPGMVFVTIGSLDNPEGIAPKLEMFTKRRLKWMKALDVP